MSVAPEYAPDVFIPERARTRRPAPVALRLVTGAGAPVQVPAALLQERPAPTAFAPIAYLPAAPVSPFAPPVRVAARPGNRTAPGQERTPLRLTRRGVIVLSGLTALLALAVLVVAHLGLASPSAAGSPRVVAGIVTVQPGDTLWSIAAQVAPQRDPRLVVDQLRRVNSLDGVSLTPGQTLKVG